MACKIIKKIEVDITNLFNHSSELEVKGKVLLNQFENLVNEVKTNPDTTAFETAVSDFIALIKTSATTA